MEVLDLADIVELHGKLIYGFCYQLTKNKIDADDLYQETFLKAVEVCYKIDKNNNPKSFLISIAIRLWKNDQRKYAWRQRIAPMQEFNEEISNNYFLRQQSTPEDIVISSEFGSVVQDAVDQLNNKLKIPLYMYYTVQMSIKDIAVTLKIPQGTVKSRLCRARKIIKDILEVGEYERI